MQVQPALKPTKFDDEVMEDEHAYIEIKEPHISNAGVNSFAVDERVCMTICDVTLKCPDSAVRCFGM